MAVTTAPYWLVIVRKDRPDLYAKLRRSFEHIPQIEVIFDRRQGERRRSGGRVEGDRRGADRRRSPTSGGQSGTGGYRLIERADGFQVLQAEGRVPTECPECATLLEFEMPRFGELPARLEVGVIHTQNGSSRVQHLVETQAFRASGRPFLACRMVARRRAEAGPSGFPSFARS